MESPNPSPNWLGLPPEVTTTIFLKLGIIEIFDNVQYVCSAWRTICKSPSMWRCIRIHESDDIWGDYNVLKKITREAIDRSSGQLEVFDSDVVTLCNDELLQYITQRSRHLRCLRVVCSFVSEDSLKETARKSPFLEEIGLSFKMLSKECVATIGQYCPLLRTFRYNRRAVFTPVKDWDGVALGIAETMPELCHLYLHDHCLTNSGLKVILDGCPHLEILDIRECYNVNLSAENLGKICSERIKKFRHPDEFSESNAEMEGDFDLDGEFEAGSDIEDYDDLKGYFW